MKTQRLALVLTVVNLVLLAFLLVRLRPVAQPDVAPVLRGRALEIVDEQGRVRSQILVAPPTTMPDGKKYPEATVFRLIDPNGRPSVKISTSVDGSGMTLQGDSERMEWSGVHMLAGTTGSTLKLTNRDGSEQLIKP